MRRLRRLWHRFANVALRLQDDERLREEAEYHIEMETEANLRAGMSLAQARRQARLRFGSLDAMRERFREEEGLPFIENFLLDYRTALQALRFSPIFSSVVITSLTLVIAVNVLILCVGQALLTSSLGIAQPKWVYQLRPETWENWKLLTTSVPVLHDLRQRNHTFVDLAGVNGYSHGVMTWGEGKGVPVRGDEVTGNYFSLLGVQAQLGSVFSSSVSDGATVVLSDNLWRKSFAANPAVIGKTVLLGTRSLKIVGVAPASFHGLERLLWPDYWTRLEAFATENDAEERSEVELTVIGRIRKDSSVEAAKEDLNALLHQLSLEHPDTDRDMSVRLVEPGLYGDMRRIVVEVFRHVALFGFVVFLAGLANLSCLSAARLAHRAREIAFRLSLGSTFSRLAQHLAIENAVLCAISGVFGTSLSVGLLSLARGTSFPFGTIHIPLGATTLGLGLLFTTASFSFLTVPVLFYLFREKQQHDRLHTPGQETGAQQQRGKDLLLIGQIALCTLLVAAATLSFDRVIELRHRHLGFDPDGVLVVTYDSDEAPNARVDPKTLLEGMSKAGGVAEVGAIDRLPMTGGLHGVPVYPQEAKSHALAAAASWPYLFVVSPGYLPAAGTTLLSGRDVRWSDDAVHTRVAIVNLALARQLWGSAQVIGKVFTLKGRNTTVVGVMEDGRYHDLDEEHRPAVYVPFSQEPSESFSLVVRPRLPAEQFRKSVGESLHQLAPGANFLIKEWPETLQTDLFPTQVEAVAMGITGVFAALLAMTGVAGIAAYSVEVQMKELAIRIALGAQRGHLLRVATGRALGLLVLGVGLGCSAERAVARVLAPGIQQSLQASAQVLCISAMVILACGLSASIYPVWKITQLEPSEVIRQE